MEFKMGTSTGQQIADNVRDHLGNRADGQIGSRGVDDAILASINKGCRAIVKRVNPEELQAELTIDVSTATNEYAIPTGTVNSLATTIKNIVASPSLLRDGETVGTILRRIYVDTLDKIEPYKDTERTGRPYYYAIFNETVTLYPFPDDDYTVTLRVNLWPPAITLAQLGPLNDEWEDVIEAYATFDCYAKLQQTQDAASWYGIYKNDFKETRGALINKPDFTVDATIRDQEQYSYRGIDPALDPFSRVGY